MVAFVLALSVGAAAADLARGQALLSGGDYAGAIRVLSALTADNSAPLSPRARAFVSLGDAHIAIGDYAAARADAAAAERGANAPPQLRCAAEEILASIDEAQSNVDAETAHYVKSLEWADRSGDLKLIGLGVDWVFHAYFSTGKSDLALKLVNERLAGAPKGHPNRARFLILEGRVLMDLRDWDGARRALDEAVPLADAGDDAWDRAAAHEFRGMLIWRSQRDRERALQELTRASVLSRSSGSPSAVAMILNTIGNIYRGSANGDRAALESALAYYTQGLEVARHAGLPDVTATALKNIGEINRALGDVPHAEQALREAIDVADRAGVMEISWMSRLYAAMLARDRDPALADRYFAESLDVVERGARNLAIDDLRAGSLAAQVTIGDNPYDQYIAFLMARQQPERAFFVAERERARVLLESLAAARETIVRDTPAPFSAAERSALTKIKTAQATLRSSALTPDRQRELVASIEQTEHDLADLRLHLAIDRPALAHARYPTLLDAAAVRTTLLAPDEALVAFYLGSDRSVAWILTPHGTTAIALPPRRAIETAVRAALQEFRNPSAHEHANVRTLSSVLAIDRIADAAGTHRLVIVPHGILYDVPFEAIADRSGRPLVERFVVSYAPSASTLALLRPSAPSRSAAPTMIAIANPVVTGAPLAGTRQVDLPHMNLLAPVPYSGEEARQIARLFGRRARVLDGPHARTADLRASGYEQARILHFATHGLIDESRPERSGLVLTADPPRDDGLLQTREIYGLRLNADLVTLSACETALGQNVIGEGMIGLTRAFFYAGARSVVASLWDVEDASTARLMQHFYANIRRGDPIDEALQRAKLDLLRAGGATANPFYWASFVVNGQARTVIESPRLLTAQNVTAAAMVLAALAAIMGPIAKWRRITVGRSRQTRVAEMS